MGRVTPNINRRLSNACNEYGSNMGRHEYKPYTLTKCYIQQVHLTEGYDTGGAYWGSPSNLWCAYSTDDAAVEIFVRAPSRRYAKAIFETRYPNLLRFFR